jgi:hypothetical protein
MVKAREVASFLDTITLLEAPNGTTPETALHEGRQDLEVVVAALEQGHPCLKRPHLLGEAPRIFLNLVSEAMGMPQFLRAQFRTVHPQVFASYVNGLLYPDPSESTISDDDLRYIAERFGKDDYRFPARVLKIIADRKNRRASQHC